MTCPDVIDLEQFVLEALDVQTTSAITAHIASCVDCAREIAELNENLKIAPALRRGSTSSEPDPEQIGAYRILRRLGQGGMGTVFEAQQEIRTELLR